MQPLIAAGELGKLLSGAATTLVLIDARNTANPLADYEAGHLPGARFADVNKDLADIKASAADGGRHPLPSASAFAKTLGRWGITPHTHVVVYDDKSGANAAARVWWMLRSIGHEKVQVLDGGMQAAVREGITIEPGSPQQHAVADYPLSDYQWPTVDMAEVEQATQLQANVIDVRDAARHRGEVEPIDIIAGHIPGAINIPFSQNLNEDEAMRQPEELRNMYEQFAKADEQDTIVHCGSGITACHSLLAMDHAGLPIPKLYVGSWSEWCNNKKPVALGA